MKLKYKKHILPSFIANIMMIYHIANDWLGEKNFFKKFKVSKIEEEKLTTTKTKQQKK